MKLACRGEVSRAKQQGTGPEGNQVILNQAAVDMIQMEDPIGKKFDMDWITKGYLSGNEATIVGVIEDFHFLSVHNIIRPLMLRLYNEEQTGWSISVRSIPGIFQESGTISRKNSYRLPRAGFRL